MADPTRAHTTSPTANTATRSVVTQPILPVSSPTPGMAPATNPNRPFAASSALPTQTGNMLTSGAQYQPLANPLASSQSMPNPQAQIPTTSNPNHNLTNTHFLPPQIGPRSSRTYQQIAIGQSILQRVSPQPMTRQQAAVFTGLQSIQSQPPYLFRPLYPPRANPSYVSQGTQTTLSLPPMQGLPGRKQQQHQQRAQGATSLTTRALPSPQAPTQSAAGRDRHGKKRLSDGEKPKAKNQKAARDANREERDEDENEGKERRNA